MGANCGPCSTNVKPKADVVRPSPRQVVPNDPPAQSRRRLESEERQGQPRSNFKVKDNGVALAQMIGMRYGRIEEAYKLDRMPFGEGAFATVKRGRDKKSNVLYAVKSINKSGVGHLEKIYEEMRILRRLDHPNIMRMHEVWEDRRRLHLVLEFCEGGELLDCIVTAKKFTEVVARSCVRHMFLAVNYLHQNLIVHRDLKPQNWLLSRKGDLMHAVIKLADFGLSRRFEDGQTLRTRCGTPDFIAPEVLIRMYTEKCDIWSLGVIVYIIISGSRPFSGSTTSEVLRAIRVGRPSFDSSVWRSVSEQAVFFAKKLLQRSVGDRPSAQRALQDEWLCQQENACSLAATVDINIERLQEFAEMNRVKKAALMVIASQVSGKQLNAMRCMFMSMDTNNDGTVTTEELRAGLRETGVDLSERLDEMIAHLDTDGSGVLDYTEFLAATMDWKLHHDEDTVRTAFSKFDQDGSGFIDRRELAKLLGDRRVLEAMHIDEGASDIFARIDVNSDGLISFDEFYAMVQEVEENKVAENADDDANQNETTDVIETEHQGTKRLSQTLAKWPEIIGKVPSGAARTPRLSALISSPVQCHSRRKENV